MKDRGMAIKSLESADIPDKELLTVDCLSGGYKPVVNGPEQNYLILTYTIAEVVDSLSILPAQLYTGYELRDEQYKGYAFQSCPIEILKMSLNELEKLKKAKLIKNSNFDEFGIKILQ